MCVQKYSWNPSTCICEYSKYLKSIVNKSVIMYDKIINLADSVSTSMRNTMPTNVTNTTSTNAVSTVSINSVNKKVRYKMDSYISTLFY